MGMLAGKLHEAKLKVEKLSGVGTVEFTRAPASYVPAPWGSGN
jgi:hypothetical protein